MSEPVVSVIIVSDYAGGTSEAQTELRECLRALTSQDFEEPAEFLLSEWEGHRNAVPADLEQILPSLRLVFSSANSSFELKNEGVRNARAELVAVLDSDCVPERGWLRAAVEAFRAHPEAAALGGRTLSPGKTRLERMAALAGRSVGDEGAAAETCHLSLYNAAFRREAFLRNPLTMRGGCCGHRLQTEAIRRSEGALRFEPGMAATHASMTWAREKEVRREMGLAIVATRMADPQQPYAGLVRLRRASIPIIVLGKSILTAWRCCLRYKHYGVRWYEVPAAMLVGVVRHVLEVPGMLQAFRGQTAGPTQLR